MLQRHPQIPWVLAEPTPQGIALRCEACGATGGAQSPQQASAFAEAHRAHQSPSRAHLGLGDVIAAGTKALGIQPCSPCEARRRALKQRFPRVFRR